MTFITIYTVLSQMTFMSRNTRFSRHFWACYQAHITFNDVCAYISTITSSFSDSRVSWLPGLPPSNWSSQRGRTWRQLLWKPGILKLYRTETPQRSIKADNQSSDLTVGNPRRRAEVAEEETVGLRDRAERAEEEVKSC